MHHQKKMEILERGKEEDGIGGSLVHGRTKLPFFFFQMLRHANQNVEDMTSFKVIKDPN